MFESHGEIEFIIHIICWVPIKKFNHISACGKMNNKKNKLLLQTVNHPSEFKYNLSFL